MKTAVCWHIVWHKSTEVADDAAAAALIFFSVGGVNTDL